MIDRQDDDVDDNSDDDNDYIMIMIQSIILGAKIKYVSFNANVIEVHRDDVQEFLGAFFSCFIILCFYLLIILYIHVCVWKSYYCVNNMYL